jgi:hypothetical protein
MTRVCSATSVKTWSILTVLVLLAHLLVLGAAATTLNLGLAQTPPRHAFSIRSVEFVPAAPAAVPQPMAAMVTRLPAKAQRPLPKDVPERRTNEDLPLPAMPQASDQPMPAQASPNQNGPSPAEPALHVDQFALAPTQTLGESTPVLNAEHVPRPVRLNYEVQSNKFPYRLNAELVWQLSGQNYDARLTVGAFGQKRVQTSRGQIGTRGLEPVRFSDKYRSEVAAHFNRQQAKVTFSANTPDVSLLPGAQDRLSVLIQLATLVASAPNRYPPATTITIQTIGPRDAETWLFTVGETETLNLPGGPQVALKLVRNARQDFDQKVELWLAPALNYMPARLLITESNGNYIDQKWLSNESPD